MGGGAASTIGMLELSQVQSQGDESMEEWLKSFTASLCSRETIGVYYRGTSPQIDQRKEIIKWLRKVAAHEKLLRKTLFLGVHFFDYFTDVHDIALKQIYLVALSCLYLAAKMEENEESSIPSMRSMKQHLPTASEFQVNLFVQIEKYILEHFKWNFITVTVVDFVEYFLMFGVESTDLVKDENNNTEVSAAMLSPFRASKSKWRKLHSDFRESHEPSAVTDRFQPHSAHYTLANEKEKHSILKSHILKMADNVFNLLNDVLLATPSADYPLSLIGAACVMFGRKSSGYSSWTSTLENITEYSQAAVEGCLDDYVSTISPLIHQLLKQFEQREISAESSHEFTSENNSVYENGRRIQTAESSVFGLSFIQEVTDFSEDDRTHIVHGTPEEDFEKSLEHLAWTMEHSDENVIVLSEDENEETVMIIHTRIKANAYV